jgi:hypothetical protein
LRQGQREIPLCADLFGLQKPPREGAPVEVRLLGVEGRFSRKAAATEREIGLIKISVLTLRMLESLRTRRYRERHPEKNREWQRLHPNSRKKRRQRQRERDPAAARESDRKKRERKRARDPEKYRAAQRRNYLRNRERQLAYNKTPEVRERQRISRQALKKKVLTHYGPAGRLNCCWLGCIIDDVDMLTLDHVNNDGAAHRKEIKTKIYSWIVKNNYPDGFQTLCGSHQMKKEFLGRYAGLPNRKDPLAI